MHNMNHKFVEHLKEIEKKTLQECKNPTEFVLLLQEELHKIGVFIHFDNYPDIESNVPNTHNAPNGYKTNWGGKNPDIPKSYPGWSGSWSGKINISEEFKKNYKMREVTFSNIKDYIKIIKTSSGSIGKEFSIGGSLFKYDFSHEETERKNVEYNECIKHSRDLLDDYRKTFKNEQAEYVKNDETMQTLNSLHSLLAELTTQCSLARQERQTLAMNEFALMNVESIPEEILEDGYFKQKFETYCEMSKVPLECNPANFNKSEKLKKISETIKTIKSSIKDIEECYPELFI